MVAPGSTPAVTPVLVRLDAGSQGLQRLARGSTGELNLVLCPSASGPRAPSAPSPPRTPPPSSHADAAVRRCPPQPHCSVSGEPGEAGGVDEAGAGGSGGSQGPLPRPPRSEADGILFFKKKHCKWKQQEDSRHEVLFQSSIICFPNHWQNNYSNELW